MVVFDPNTDIPDLTGRVIIVTGGNAGLGLETIRQLAKHHTRRIYLAARSREKADAAIGELQQASTIALPITFLRLDLSSFASIKTAVETFTQSEKRLDLLINNAGIMMTPEALTEDGYEIQFGTNVLGPTRVVNLASASDTQAPSDIYQFDELKTTMAKRHTTARYTMSKLADVYYTSALARRVQDVNFVSVHPGMVATNLHHNATGSFLTRFLNVAVKVAATLVAKGAHLQLWAAISEDITHGGYYGPVGVPAGSKASHNERLSEQLWVWVESELRQHAEIQAVETD